jgi:hypothetical protein
MKHSRLLLLVLFVTAILLLSQPNIALLSNPNTGVVPQNSQSQTAGQAQPKFLKVTVSYRSFLKPIRARRILRSSFCPAPADTLCS